MKKDFGFVFFIHLILIILVYVSPFLFDWKLILMGVLYIYIQEIFLKGCFLTHLQFGKDKDMTFYYKYLTLLGFRINKKKLKFFMGRIMPLIILGVALVWQEVLGVSVLVSF